MTQERMAPITTGGSSESVLLPEDADSIPVIPITYGYARVSKADDDSKNLETQLRELDAHGIRRDLVFTDEASGRTMDRPCWQDLMSRVQPGDTIVVAFLDRFSRNFEKGVAIQAELTARDIGIVALWENIDGSAAAKFSRRSFRPWLRPACLSGFSSCRWAGVIRPGSSRPPPPPPLDISMHAPG